QRHPVPAVVRVAGRRVTGAADVRDALAGRVVVARRRVGCETLSRENSRLVYCAISGYGQDGPYRDRAGHDVNYIGYGGVLSLTGQPAGEPVLPGVQVGDLGGGAMVAAVGSLAALVEWASTGRGRV